jgi:integrase
MRTIFITIYAAGLRVSEVIALAAANIDSQRMVIHVRQGKGRKDRYVMLSEQLLTILRDYYKKTQPPVTCLFPGQDGERPVTARTVQVLFVDELQHHDNRPLTHFIFESWKAKGPTRSGSIALGDVYPPDRRRFVAAGLYAYRLLGARDRRPRWAPVHPRFT